jgi:hypothetical protein
MGGDRLLTRLTGQEIHRSEGTEFSLGDGPSRPAIERDLMAAPFTNRRITLSPDSPMSAENFRITGDRQNTVEKYFNATAPPTK